MTKNYFFKVVLLGVTLFLVASQIAGLTVRLVDFLFRLTSLPNTFKPVVEIVFQLGTFAVLAFLAYMIYESKYKDEKWVSSFTLVQLTVFLGFVVINSVLDVLRYGDREFSGFEFRFWMISGFLFNLGLFIGLLIITLNLKNSAPSAPKQVRYSAPAKAKRAVEKSSLTDSKTPPDLPV